MKKAVSILLILAAAFGFYGGAMDLNDVLDCKEYWEEQGRITDENLTKLEDGIAQLEENTEKYLDGKKQYEDGLVQLAEAKASYAAAPAKLADAKRQLTEGKALLAAGIKTYKEGVATYEASEKLINQLAAGIDGYDQQYKAWLVKMGQLDAVRAQAAKELDKVSEKPSGFGLVYLVHNMMPEKEAELTAGIKQMHEYDGMNAGMYQIAALLPGVIDQLKDAEQLQIGNLRIANIMDEYDALKKANEILTTQNYTKRYEAVMADGQAVVAVAKQVIGGILQSGNDQLINGMNQNYEGLVVPALKEQLPQAYWSYLQPHISGYLADEAWKIQEMEVFYAITTGLDQLFNGIKDTALAGLADGKAQLDAGAKKIAVNQKKLAAGEKQYQAGLATFKAAPGLIADGEAKLADGKSQLDQYEDGMSTLRDGLNTLMTTEAQGGLESIASRVGEGETFNDANGNMDFEKAKFGAAQGRAYSSDSGDAITPELTNRGIAAAVGLAASLLALIAAAIGFTKKNKLAGTVGVLAFIAGLAGIFMTSSAGSTWTVIAGSTIGSLPMVAFGVVAGVALIHAFVQYAAKKA